MTIRRELPVVPNAAETRREVAVERALTKARVRAEERTAALIDAAFELVAERDSLEFTVQEVVDRTGLSLHAFYQLFTSKDDLVQAVYEEAVVRGARVLRERVEQHQQPLDRLRAFVLGYYDISTSRATPGALASGRAFSELSVHLGLVDPTESWTVYRPLRVLAYDILREGVADGSIRSDKNLDLLAGFVLYTVRSLTNVAMTQPGQSWATGPDIWDMIAAGVAAPRSSPMTATRLGAATR